MKQDLCQHLSDPSFGGDRELKDWIDAMANEYGLCYLLAHADDGVIWGHFKKGQLLTSDAVNPKYQFFQFPPLRSITLQQCRIFGTEGEVLLWKSAGTWKARFVGQLDLEAISEAQILWGTKGEEFADEGFTVLQDGSQGLRHAVPLTGIRFAKLEENHRPVRLLVHHYIDYDCDGLARIVLSRLVDLKPEDQ